MMHNFRWYFFFGVFYRQFIIPHIFLQMISIFFSIFLTKCLNIGRLSPFAISNRDLIKIGYFLQSPKTLVKRFNLTDNIPLFEK